LLCEQVPREHVVAIREYPFTRALRRSFELAIELGRPWTLCVDADMLLRVDGVRTLLDCARASADNVFQVQGNLFDKLFGGPRWVSPRLYRTSLLPKALSGIPADGAAPRPEAAVLDYMASLGHPSLHRDVTIGLHDFEQYDRDIYRKAFHHAHKHDHFMPRLEPLWRRLAAHDADYEVALWGLRDGRSFTGIVPLDVRRFPADLGVALQAHGWKEKAELSTEGRSSRDVDLWMLDYVRWRASVAQAANGLRVEAQG
jgi:hypothetical protein